MTKKECEDKIIKFNSYINIIGGLYPDMDEIEYEQLDPEHQI